MVARAGAELVRGRLRLVERLLPNIGSSYSALAGQPAAVVGQYEAEWAGPTGLDPDAVEARLRQALVDLRRREIDRGITLAGPHRDEWRLVLNGLDTRSHASQGEQRCLALALRLAGHEVCRTTIGTAPVLLLVALVFAPLLPVAAATLVEAGTRFAERALALPVAGLALALATLAAGAPGRARWPAKVLLLGWVLWQTVVTVPLVDVWRDDEARIRRVVHVRPNDPDALLGLADLLSSLGRPDEAANLIARAEVLSPGGHDALLARASAEFRAGRLPQALIAAEQALARDRGSLAAGVIRVRTLARLARTAEAVADGEALCASFPAEPAATGALGAARFASGDAAGAKPLLADASAHLLDDSGLAWDLGRAAIATGDIVTARAAFERAVRAAPEFYEAWLGVADTRARLGDGPGAQAALVRAQALPGAADGRAAALRARIGSP